MQNWHKISPARNWSFKASAFRWGKGGGACRNVTQNRGNYLNHIEEEEQGKQTGVSERRGSEDVREKKKKKRKLVMEEEIQ